MGAQLAWQAQDPQARKDGSGRVTWSWMSLTRSISSLRCSSASACCDSLSWPILPRVTTQRQTSCCSIDSKRSHNIPNKAEIRARRWFPIFHPPPKNVHSPGGFHPVPWAHFIMLTSVFVIVIIFFSGAVLRPSTAAPLCPPVGYATWGTVYPGPGPVEEAPGQAGYI